MTMTNLSPQTQAILDAFLNTPGSEPMAGWDYKRDLGAAIRAAADWVTPKCSTATTADYSAGANNERIVVRSQLLAIADELESQES